LVCRPHDLPGDVYPHCCVLLFDRGGFAAERQERRHRGGVRRPRQPDGIRPARRGDGFVESNDLVGHHLYGDFDYAVGAGIACRIVRGRFGVVGREVDANPVEAGHACPASHASRSEVSSGFYPVTPKVLPFGRAFCFCGNDWPAIAGVQRRSTPHLLPSATAACPRTIEG